MAEGLSVYGVDAAPSFVQAFRRNLPNTPIACEAVQDSKFFDRTFDGVLAWGFMFVLSPDDQRRLIQRIADILVPGGRLLFTSPAEIGSGTDVMTRREFRSLGAEEYRQRLSAVGLTVAREYQDEGQNHYFDAFKELKTVRPRSVRILPVLADSVAKVENRATPKIPQKLIFSQLRHCNTPQRR